MSEGSDAGEIGGHAGEHGGDHHGGVFGDHHGAFGSIGHNHGTPGHDVSHAGGHPGHGPHTHAPHGIYGQLGHDANMAGGLGYLIDRAPTTWLPVGIDNGLKYVAETYGHARTFGANYSVDKCVPRGTALNARMAEVVALEAARSVGGVNELSNYKTGYLFEHPTFTTFGVPAEGSDPGRRVNLPGIARNTTIIELLVWPHGQCNPKEKLREVLARLGLSRLDLRMAFSLPDIEKPAERRIYSANPFAAVDDGLNPPNGWFRPPTGDRPVGITSLWREFYQVKGCFASLFNPKDKDLYGTFIAVFGCTWFFEKSGDYETRIAFAVYSAPYVPQQHQTWKWNIIRDHRIVAEKAAKEMVSFISGFPAKAESIETRRKLRLELTEPVVPAPRDPFDVPPTPLPVVPPVPSEVGDPAGPEEDEKRQKQRR